MLGNVIDAEDVVQEAYVKAYRALMTGEFDGRANVSTWLYRIVTNQAIDAMREPQRAARSRPTPRTSRRPTWRRPSKSWRSPSCRIG